MSTDSIGSEFSLDDSGKCDNKMTRSHSLHDARTLNSEPMSEDDDDDDDNNALLDQCINAGIEKITALKINEELPDDEQQELLNQCIATGIKNSAKFKSQMPVKKKTKKQDNDLTDEQQDNSSESYIVTGVKDRKKSFKSKRNDELSDSEQVALLNECIAAGMKNLQKNKPKENNALELNVEENLLNNCISQGIRNTERESSHKKKREIPVLSKHKKLFALKSESEISESTSTITPRDVFNGIQNKRDESDESTWKDDETLTFSTLTSSYQSANTGENSKSKLIQLDKGGIGNINIDKLKFVFSVNFFFLYQV